MARPVNKAIRRFKRAAIADVGFLTACVSGADGEGEIQAAPVNLVLEYEDERGPPIKETTTLPNPRMLDLNLGRPVRSGHANTSCRTNQVIEAHVDKTDSVA